MTSTRRNSLDVKVNPIGLNNEKSGAAQSSEKAVELSGSSMQERSIDLKGGVTMIISLMIGSGIFTFAGEVHQHVNSSGFALCIWLISGILALTGALCYAELGTMIPGSGGEAQYLTRGFGPLSTYIFDWTSILILKPGTVAVMLIAFSKYTVKLIQVFAPTWMQFEEPWIRGIACVGCFAVTALSSCSHKWSNFILDALTWCKVAALGMIIGGGTLFYAFVDSKIFSQNVLNAPFAETVPRTNPLTFFVFISGMVKALCSGLWGFEGWNNLNIVAGDLKNPKRNLPLAIWISVGTVLGLYLATLLAYYCAIPATDFMNCETVGLLFGQNVTKGLFGEYWSWVGGVIFALAIMGSTFSAALSSMLTSSEIIVLSANSGNIPAPFGVIDSRTKTAVNAYTLQGIISIVLAALFADNLLPMYTFPTWIFYLACALILIKLRFTAPDLERPYRVWFSTPVLFSVSCVLFMGFLFNGYWGNVLVSIIIMTLGVPVYFWYRKGQNVMESKN